MPANYDPVRDSLPPSASPSSESPFPTSSHVRPRSPDGPRSGDMGTVPIQHSPSQDFRHHPVNASPQHPVHMQRHKSQPGSQQQLAQQHRSSHDFSYHSGMIAASPGASAPSSPPLIASPRPVSRTGSIADILNSNSDDGRRLGSRSHSHQGVHIHPGASPESEHPMNPQYQQYHQQQQMAHHAPQQGYRNESSQSPASTFRTERSPSMANILNAGTAGAISGRQRSASNSSGSGLVTSQSFPPSGSQQQRPGSSSWSSSQPPPLPSYTTRHAGSSPALAPQHGPQQRVRISSQRGGSFSYTTSPAGGAPLALHPSPPHHFAVPERPNRSPEVKRNPLPSSPRSGPALVPMATPSTPGWPATPTGGQPPTPGGWGPPTPGGIPPTPGSLHSLRYGEDEGSHYFSRQVEHSFAHSAAASPHARSMSSGGPGAYSTERSPAMQPRLPPGQENHDFRYMRRQSGEGFGNGPHAVPSPAASHHSPGPLGGRDPRMSVDQEMINAAMPINASPHMQPVSYPRHSPALSHIIAAQGRRRSSQEEILLAQRAEMERQRAEAEARAQTQAQAQAREAEARERTMLMQARQRYDQAESMAQLSKAPPPASSPSPLPSWDPRSDRRRMQAFSDESYAGEEQLPPPSSDLVGVGRRSSSHSIVERDSRPATPRDSDFDVLRPSSTKRMPSSADSIVGFEGEAHGVQVGEEGVASASARQRNPVQSQSRSERVIGEIRQSSPKRDEAAMGLNQVPGRSMTTEPSEDARSASHQELADDAGSSPPSSSHAQQMQGDSEKSLSHDLKMQQEAKPVDSSSSVASTSASAPAPAPVRTASLPQRPLSSETAPPLMKRIRYAPTKRVSKPTSVRRPITHEEREYRMADARNPLRREWEEKRERMLAQGIPVMIDLPPKPEDACMYIKGDGFRGTGKGWWKHEGVYWPGPRMSKDEMANLPLNAEGDAFDHVKYLKMLNGFEEPEGRNGGHTSEDQRDGKIGKDPYDRRDADVPLDPRSDSLIEPDSRKRNRMVAGMEDAAEVADHYNKRREVGIEAREESPIIKLRKFNNWIKSVLIGQFARGQPGHEDRNGKPRNGRILDLGCGKGGDLKKWDKTHPREFVGVDIAEVSIEQARNRHKETGQRWKATFFAFDCFGTPLSQVIPRELLEPGFDSVTLQFCMHYAWESVQKARLMLENVSRYMRRGATFIGTIPDAERMMRRLESLPSDKLAFGNKYYKVVFDQKESQPPFGNRYTFFLEDAVENVPEFVVDWRTFSELAEEVGLRCIYRKNFEDIFRDESRRPEFGRLLERMKVTDRYGRVDMDEMLWEAASFYLGFAFEKC
ncbi:hypothetical protein IE53DRAFT_98188 [Violaceomyces palustris]|uniref:Uncharacterized protein n=1 Tax=Violaceomyces palustris TaxID=1673888 RepID=A0ACD0NWY0_9BASI|nr:hypothetical protein IE53DRAFT_98188 [Violaceomyces palustris]